MRVSGIFFGLLIVPALVVASPNTTRAEEEGSFLLQDDGGVRVTRGIESGTDFEPATLPQEDEETQASEPEAQAEQPSASPQAQPKLTTREKALQRSRERGIPVIRAGERRAPGPEVDSTRKKAIERQRQRGIVVHGPG